MEKVCRILTRGLVSVLCSKKKEQRKGGLCNVDTLQSTAKC
jgi:hypothetical protein